MMVQFLSSGSLTFLEEKVFRWWERGNLFVERGHRKILSCPPGILERNANLARGEDNFLYQVVAGAFTPAENLGDLQNSPRIQRLRIGQKNTNKMCVE